MDNKISLVHRFGPKQSNSSLGIYSDSFAKFYFRELSNFAAAIGAGAKFLTEQNAGVPFSIKKGIP